MLMFICASVAAERAAASASSEPASASPSRFLLPVSATSAASVATSEASSSTCMGTAIAPDTASSRHAVRWSPFSIRSASSTTP